MSHQIIAVVNSELLPCYTKPKCRAPAYSWALCHVTGLSRGKL